jgi:hypothetical protein
MQGASLHRRHRFRELKRTLSPQPAVQPAKAVSRLGLPHAVQDAVALAFALEPDEFHSAINLVEKPRKHVAKNPSDWN